MARSGASLVALMAVIFAVLSVIGAAQSAESPAASAPGPTSLAFVNSPSFLSAFFAALVALVASSALRV